MTKGSNNKRIFFNIMPPVLALAFLLVSCQQKNYNSTIQAMASSYQTITAEGTFSNLILDPLLNPLGMGDSVIITKDSLKYTSGLPNPFSAMTSSDVNNYYNKLKSANELSGSENHVMATVNGEPIYLSDIEKAKALVQLFASTNIIILQSSSSAYEDESVYGDNARTASFYSYMSQIMPNASAYSRKLDRYKSWYSISNNQYVAWLIQDKVIIQNALKSGISLSNENIYTQATLQYNLINSGNSYLNEMTLKAYGMKKDDYIRYVLMPIMKNYDLIAMFEQNYISKNKQGLKQYVDGLVAQSSVQYK